MVPIEEIRSLASIYEMGGIVALLGIVVVGASGLYMALTVWSLRAIWVQVGIGAFALMAPVGPLVVSPCIELLIRAARRLGDGPLSPALMARAATHCRSLGCWWSWATSPESSSS